MYPQGPLAKETDTCQQNCSDAECITRSFVEENRHLSGMFLHGHLERDAICDIHRDANISTGTFGKIDTLQEHLSKESNTFYDE